VNDRGRGRGKSSESQNEGDHFKKTSPERETAMKRGESALAEEEREKTSGPRGAEGTKGAHREGKKEKSVVEAPAQQVGIAQTLARPRKNCGTCPMFKEREERKRGRPAQT